MSTFGRAALLPESIFSKSPVHDVAKPFQEDDRTKDFNVKEDRKFAGMASNSINFLRNYTL